MANAQTDKKKSGGRTIVTPEFRVSFPYVFNPQKQVGDDGVEYSKYGLSMIFPKTTDINAIKQLVLECIQEKFGEDKAKWPKLRLPFRDGADKEYDGYGPDVTFMSATAGKNRPGLVNQELQPILNPEEFYGGCYARATIRAFFYDKKGKGIGIGLQNIQKTRDGEPFSGRTKAENDFDAIPMPKASAAEMKDPLSDIGA